MKKLMYALLLPLVVISGIVFANHESKTETPETSTPKPPAASDKKAALKVWETSPEGMKFKEWEASPAGMKVYASEAKISKAIRDFSNMEAVVTSLSLPEGSRLGFGVMVKIDGDDYILSFGSAQPDELKELQTLKVGDKIMLKSRNVSHAPKYAYPIVSGDYVERDGKLLYKRIPRKDGC